MIRKFFLAMGLLIACSLAMGQERSVTPTPQAQAVSAEKHTVYVPYDDLEKVFRKEGRGAFIPYKEFLELWEKQRPIVEKEKEKEAVESVIYDGSYVMIAEKKVASVKAIYKIRVCKNGWTKVPFNLQNAAITKATLDNKTALLSAQGNQYELLIEGIGDHTLELEFKTSVSGEGAEKVARFGCPKIPVVKFEADIPGKELDIEINPMLVGAEKNEAGDRTRLAAYLEASGEIVVSWKPLMREGAKGGGLLFVRNNLLHVFKQGTLATVAQLELEILKQPRAEFKFSVSNVKNLVGVEGANVKDWSADEAAKTLTVILHNEVKGSYSLRLLFEENTQNIDGVKELPEIYSVDANRETGFLGVAAENGLNIKLENKSLTLGQIDFSEFPNLGDKRMENASLALAYKYLKTPVKISVNVEKISPKITVESRAKIEIDEEILTMTWTLGYEISRAGVFQFQFEIPAIFSIDSIRDDKNIEDYVVTDSENKGWKKISVNLPRKIEGTYNLTVKAQSAFAEKKDERELDLPQIRPLGELKRHTGVIAISAKKSLELNTARLERLIPISVSELRNLAFQETMEMPLALGFKYLEQGIGCKLNVKKRSSKVTGEVWTYANVKEDMLQVNVVINYFVEYAGVSEFSFELPQSIAEKINITTDSGLIKEKKIESIDKTKPETYAVWKVILQTKQLGNFPLSFNYEIPIEGLAAGGEKPEQIIALEEVVLRDIEKSRETGYIVISKAKTLEINPGETSRSLELIDLKELPGTMSVSMPGDMRGSAFLAYKYSSHPVKLPLQVVRHEFEAVKRMIVQYAEAVTVVSPDFRASSDFTFAVKNADKQYFDLKLPSGSEFLKVEVDGVEVQPAKSENGWSRIRLTRSADREDTTISIAFWTMLGAKGDKFGHFGSRNIRMPEIETSVPVVIMNWYLYLPKDYTYFDFGGNMEDRRPYRTCLDTLLRSRVGGYFDSPRYKTSVLKDINVNDWTLFFFTRQGKDANLDIKYFDRSTLRTLAIVLLLILVIAGLFAVRRWKYNLLKIALFYAVAGLLISTQISAGWWPMIRAVFYAAGLLFIWLIVKSIYVRYRASAACATPTPPPVENPPEVPSGNSPDAGSASQNNEVKEGE